MKSGIIALVGTSGYSATRVLTVLSGVGWMDGWLMMKVYSINGGSLQFIIGKCRRSVARSGPLRPAHHAVCAKAHHTVLIFSTTAPWSVIVLFCQLYHG